MKQWTKVDKNPETATKSFVTSEFCRSTKFFDVSKGRKLSHFIHTFYYILRFFTLMQKNLSPWTIQK